MNCINEEVILSIIKSRKKYVIKTIITALLFCLSIICLLLVTTREFEQIFIFSFFVVFSLLLNLLYYFIFECINKINHKIRLYNQVIISNNKQIKAEVIEDMQTETFAHVSFHAYKIKDENDKTYRILIPTEYILDINCHYVFLISRNVVIYYEKK